MNMEAMLDGKKPKIVGKVMYSSRKVFFLRNWLNG